MGVLNYLYTCESCGHIHPSYFSGKEECGKCGSNKIKCEDIKKLGIEKFEKENHYWEVK